MVLRSRAIWARKGCVIGDAAVRVRGDRIVEVGSCHDLPPGDGEPVVDIGESIIFPAFVNAHCHLEYSGLAGEISRDLSFTGWLNQIITIKQSLTHEDHESAWLAGAEMLLRTGCGTVVNIESLPGLYERMAPETQLQVCPFTELIGYHSEDVDEMVDLAERELMVNAPLALSSGLSAHAPYTVTQEALSVLAAFADEHSISTTIHLAESNDEWEMFSDGVGALYETMRGLGRLMDDCGVGTPVQHLAKSGGFAKKTLVVHANRITDDDVELLRKANADVVHCPRSHAWFGHARFDYDRLAKAGLNVCLGTDSLASVGGDGGGVVLDMFAEMQELSRNHSNLLSEDILQMATANGAAAMRLESEIGQIKEGFMANMTMIPFDGSLSEVPEMILHHQGPVEMLMIAGRRAFSRAGSVVD
ncbi:MAG: amidohydrolase family protein [Verrucomicrobiota bacterium]|nr:amidohydrolase family protein [Verrucomicrobiota bacterium]